MKLVSIEECEVTITLGVDECDLLARGLQRAAGDLSEREQAYYWQAVASALLAASIPARMVGDIPADRHPAVYLENQRRRMARLGGKDGEAA